jgi:alpha-tubulin suppressor-like RCC1 family protein
MSERYPGGFINRSSPVVVGPTDGEGGSAPGVWTLEQASGYVKQGLWPQPIIPKILYSWGSNNNGQLGQNIAYTISRSSPVQVGALTDWSKISALGGTGMAAIKSNGTLWTWGNNDSGRLGQNDIIKRSSPVQVGALTNWAFVGSSGDEAGHAIKTNGTLWSWGFNFYGTLGNNDTANQSSPVQIGSGTNWKSVGGGANATIAVKTDGTLWSWGYNVSGALGQNNTVNLSSPVQVGALTNWASITNNSAGNFCLAIKTDGTLWSWGLNSAGQLGLGDAGSYGATNRSSPTQVGALTTWAKVSAGNGTCGAIRTDGTLWTWGADGSGELGQNVAGFGFSKSSPVQVGSLTDWSSITSRSSFMTAVKTDGTLWTWGSNTDGRLGQNTAYAERRSSPVQVGALTTWLNTSQGYAVIALTRNN